MKRITVLMADDNKLVRKEFKKILELEDDIEVVGEAKNGHEAVAMFKKLRPALVLMDVAMPLLNGLQSICQILKAFPAAKVLMLSAHNDEAYIAGAVNSGAMGYPCPSLRTPRLREASETGWLPSLKSLLTKPDFRACCQRKHT